MPNRRGASRQALRWARRTGLSAGTAADPPALPPRRTHRDALEGLMTDDLDFPAPAEGFVLTHFVVVSDQDRSREWYERVLGARTVNPRDPVIVKVANSWIILNVGGGPTEDKPDVVLEAPSARIHR